MRQLQDDIVERRRQSRMEQEPFIEEDEGLSDWSKFDESRKKCQISHPGHKPNSPNWTSSPLTYHCSLLFFNPNTYLVVQEQN